MVLMLIVETYLEVWSDWWVRTDYYASFKAFRTSAAANKILPPMRTGWGNNPFCTQAATVRGVARANWAASR